MAYRKDRNITKEIPHYRRILAHITPDRDSASVFFPQTFDLSKTLPWIEKTRQATGEKVTLLHVYMAAIARTFHRHPGLNRYVQGYRVYQRDGVYITTSAKKKLVHGSKIVMLKLQVEPEDTPVSICERFKELLAEGRSGKELHQEKEVSLFLKLPGWLLAIAIKVMGWLDRMHWLPGAFVDPDPMYTSMTIANLGSVGLGSGFHHLYEYGNCPFFTVMGRVRDEPVAVNGKVEIHPLLDISVTFDERIEDGLATAIGLSGLKEYIEDPDCFTTGISDLQGKPPTNLQSKVAS